MKRHTILLFIFLANYACVTESSRSLSATPPQANGPVDIQANEQEFASDRVIARGNVHVKYKDSIVIAPQATLYRDSAGNPQRAVFTGHPRLVQGENKIDADVLIFEINDQQIIAEGNAHSEVIGNEADDITKDRKMSGGRRGEEPCRAERVHSGGSEGTELTERLQKDRKMSGARRGESGGGDGIDKNPTSADSIEMEMRGENARVNSDQAKPELVSKKKTNQKAQPPEKIITDSDRQEYQRSSGKFEAVGHVRVKHADISVRADKLHLVYGTDNKPETAVFTGNVSATQNQNNTKADRLTYFLTTKRLQATGHVKSKVIQERKPDAAKKSKPITQSSTFLPGSAGAANAAELSDRTLISRDTDDPIEIMSDAQDYSSENGRVTADGNVRVYYQDTVGIGPKVILLRNSSGRAEKVLFVGRSQISQPGKRWIGDRITFTVQDKKVLAQGNTKAFILQTPGKGRQSGPDASSTKLAGRPQETREAGKISTTKIEATR